MERAERPESTLNEHMSLMNNAIDNAPDWTTRSDSPWQIAEHFSQHRLGFSVMIDGGIERDSTALRCSVSGHRTSTVVYGLDSQSVRPLLD